VGESYTHFVIYLDASDLGDQLWSSFNSAITIAPIILLLNVYGTMCTLKDMGTKIVLLLTLTTAIFALPQDATFSSKKQLKRDLPIGTCNPDTPCPNGACCGSNGLCGYSPTECGSGCNSNCGAKAECGQYGTPGSQNCPLSVCCSEFGLVLLLVTLS
jgi:hypothetical protein